MQSHHHIVAIAEYEHWKTIHPVILSGTDRNRHVYIVGQTGTGKSTLLQSIVAADIEAGHGVALLDPHGDLATESLSFVPPRRADDLVYFNPSDLSHPVAFNMLANVPPDRRSVFTSAVVSAFKSIWRESWGPRLEHVLSASIAALLECENTSLLGLYRMLTDARYRDGVVRRVNDPIVRAFWLNEFAGYDERFRSEVVAPILNKVGPLIMSPLVRNVFGQVKSRLDLREVMDGRKIFIANLSKGLLGEDKSNLFGAMLVARFQVAAMSRADIPEHDRVPFTLVVDEFQNFTSDSFTSMLAESRKQNLAVVLANQFLDQIRPEFRDAIFGNCGSLVSFRVGDRDAERLAREFGKHYEPAAFGNLPNFHIIARMLDRGEPRAPVIARTLRYAGVRHNRPQKLIDRSRRLYATPRHIVEGKIQRWLKTSNSKSS